MYRKLLILAAMIPSTTLAQDVNFRFNLTAPLLMSGGTSQPPGTDASDRLEIFLDNPFPAHGTLDAEFASTIAVIGGVPGYTTFVDGDAPEGIDFTGQMAKGAFD